MSIHDATRTLFAAYRPRLSLPSGNRRLLTLTGIVLATLFMIGLLGFLIVVARVVVSSTPVVTVVEPPRDLLPGKQRFPTGNECESLHNGRFNCRLDIHGSVVKSMYDSLSQTVVYTTTSTPDQVLGDLVRAWGTPIGYSRKDHSVLVYWSTRVAHLAPCFFQPTTRVSYVAYGFQEPVPDRWRGFVSQFDDCPLPRND